MKILKAYHSATSMSACNLGDISDKTASDK
jgi:hypothetical protein